MMPLFLTCTAVRDGVGVSLQKVKSDSTKDIVDENVIEVDELNNDNLSAAAEKQEKQAGLR